MEGVADGPAFAMRVHSLAHRTELNLARYEGEVCDWDDYVAVKTPSHPEYWWGNYIVFSSAPRSGDLKRWSAIFRKEYSYYPEIRHMAFTWDLAVAEQGETGEFEAAGFELDKAEFLYASRVNVPPKPNTRVMVRPVASDSEMEQAIELQMLTSGEGMDKAEYMAFIRRRMAVYRGMAGAGKGNWFGAFLGDRLAGHLGLFHDGKAGLIFDVATHPDFTRQGICGTLVHEASARALADYHLETLVLEADPGYHAKRIYESVGFEPGETTYSLEWSRGS